MQNPKSCCTFVSTTTQNNSAMQAYNRSQIARRAHQIAQAKKYDQRFLTYGQALAYGFKMAWAIAKGTITNGELDTVCSMLFRHKADQLHGELASIAGHPYTTWLTKSGSVAGLDLAKLAEVCGEKVYVMANLDSKSVGCINVISKARNKAVPALKGLTFTGNNFGGPAEVVAAIETAVVWSASIEVRKKALKKEMGRA